MLDDGVFLLVFEREQGKLAIVARVVTVGEQPLLRAFAGRISMIFSSSKSANELPLGRM